MSGPKVVNIAAIRRQQKRQGLAALHQLERAINACRRFHQQDTANELLARLHRMRDSEQWAELAIEGPRHHEFLKDQLQQLQRQHAENHAAALRRAHRRTQATAQQSLMAAEEFHNNESIELLNLSAVFTDPAALPATGHIQPAPADPHEQRLETCWQLLGQLAALEDSPTLQTLTEKAGNIRHASVERRPILLDSLALEISEHLKHQRTLTETHNELHAILADITELEDSTHWSQKITTALASQPTSLESLGTLAREARAWADAAFEQETRRAQHAAVLRAIAASGYEVRQGMATAWAENGRIVLQKPNDSQYGIEISSPPKGNAIQTRVVAFHESRDPRRDLEIEETWCSEFQHSRDLLQSEGFQATLVQAKPSGAVPLKVISAPAPTSRAHHHESPLQQSQRPGN